MTIRDQLANDDERDWNAQFKGFDELPPACETCGRLPGERHKATRPVPSIETIEQWEHDGEIETTDGCVVELDGRCEHGHRAWTLVLGLA